MNVKTENNFFKIKQIHNETLQILGQINLNYEQVKYKLGLNDKNDNKNSINTINDIIVNIQEEPKKQEVSPKIQEVAPKKQEEAPKIQEAPKKDINAVILDKKNIVFTNTGTTDSSEISKNIMNHIFNVVYKDNDFIEKYLKSEEEGLNSLIYCISNLFKLMRIFNQDFFMRLLTILSEKDAFEEMFNTINEDFEDKDDRKQYLIDSFFIKFGGDLYDTTIKKIYKQKEKELEQKCNRDLAIYRTYYNESNNKIMLMNQFLYDFIQSNNETGLKKLLVNTKGGKDVANILIDLIENVLKLKEIYGNYKDKIDTINDYYKQIVDKHSRIF